ncbi:hypothetical protein CVT24_004579 [Panaeolus cyanescens]|uniref:CBM1 domain-containing protein n=1 Tax=Panaeolus cyanescens TaxID=181874 RepID=A0A409VA45_9AGAR|nr:hypothetical protein CVT24_004579 [Panaeolus cyanescens]
MFPSLLQFIGLSAWAASAWAATTPPPQTTTTPPVPVTTLVTTVYLPEMLPHYAQCGGVGWNGAIGNCAPPYTCKYFNEYYSQWNANSSPEQFAAKWLDKVDLWSQLPSSISAQGVDHNIPVQAADVLNWFGLTGGGGGSTTTSPSQTTTPPPVTTTVPSTTPPPATTVYPPETVPHWGQCGGAGWTGGTTCASPYTCTAINQWHSQCL